MINERIYLDDQKKSYIDSYVTLDSRIEPRDAILVIPGGAYSHVCLDREGECVALAFASRGINAFVLKYRVGEGEHFPNQLIDSARAMAYIKNNAEKYHINPDRVFAVGFSAGGHLVGTLATMYGEAEELLGLQKDIARPRGVIFGYPVVSAFPPANEGSFRNLLGKPFSDLTYEERMRFSIEKRITENTPPAFIWHTAEDEGVPPHGSLDLAKAYVEAGVTVELHLYPYGPHGTALGMKMTSAGNESYIQPKIQEWLEESVAWIKTV